MSLSFLIFFFLASVSEAAMSQLTDPTKCIDPRRMSFVDAYDLDRHVKVPDYAQTAIACKAQNKTTIVFRDLPVNTLKRQTGRWELFVGLSSHVRLQLDDGIFLEAKKLKNEGLTMYRYPITKFPSTATFYIYGSPSLQQYTIPTIFTTELHPVTLSKTPAITATSIFAALFLFFIIVGWQILRK
jgi:hypothetical protein